MFCMLYVLYVYITWPLELFTFLGRKLMLTKTGQSLWALTKTGQFLWGLTSSINCFRQYSSKNIGLRYQRPACHIRIIHNSLFTAQNHLGTYGWNCQMLNNLKPSWKPDHTKVKLRVIIWGQFELITWRYFHSMKLQATQLPAGTSARSDICEGFTIFWLKFYNRHLWENIPGSTYQQPIFLVEK